MDDVYMDARARLIGEIFVRHYYEILFKSPELTHKFYQEWSVLTRPDRDGVLSSVTTKQAINDLIVSLDFKSYGTHIKSTDVQRSWDGIVLLVTGYLTRKEDQLQKKFVQSFFLAPQPRGFYVFNDVFRYVDEDESLQRFLATVNEPTLVSQHTVVNPETPVNRNSLDRGVEADNHVENGEESVPSAEVVDESDAHSSQNEDISITEMATSDAKKDVPKKSHASSVDVMNWVRCSLAVHVSVNKAKVTSWNTEQHQVGSAAAAPGPEASAPISNNASAASDSHGEGICFFSRPFQEYFFGNGS